jgi:hypothetical protein
MSEDKPNNQTNEESRKRVPLSEIALDAWNTMSSSTNKGAAMSRYIDIGLEYERIGLSQPLLASLEASGVLSFVCVLIGENSTLEAKQAALASISMTAGIPLTSFGLVAANSESGRAIDSVQQSQLEEAEEEEYEEMPVLDIGGGLLG